MAIDIDLTPYDSIRTHLLCRLEVSSYRVEQTDVPSAQTFYFTDSAIPLIVGGNEYLAIGKLLNTEYGTGNIRSSDDFISLTLSGVPNDSVREILNSEIKGSRIVLARAFFDPKTNQAISIRPTGGNIVDRFGGFVINYTVDETFNVEALDNTVTINLQCASFVSIFKRKVSGLKTNPEELKKFTNGQDISFDRIPNLVGATYNFGAPK